MTIFEQALALSSSQEREAYLREACAGDAALLERLHGLLRAHYLSGQFLEHRKSSPVVGLSGPPFPGAEPQSDCTGEEGLVPPNPSAEAGNTGPEVPPRSDATRFSNRSVKAAVVWFIWPNRRNRCVAEWRSRSSNRAWIPAR